MCDSRGPFYYEKQNGISKPVFFYPKQNIVNSFTEIKKNILVYI